MFKKPVKIGAQNQLSGKDRKTIKNKLVLHFDPDSIDAILKTDKIVCNKVSNSKMLIYVNDQYPLFVDGTGKEDFFPSIYACTAYEPLAKTISINEGVENYIFNGANLMWPGVRDLASLGEFKKDQVVSIKNSKGQIVGVGAMGCSLQELKKNTDGSGIAVYILHYRGDRLWDMGSKQNPEVIIKSQLPKQEDVVVEKKEQGPKEEEKVEKKGKKEEKVEEKGETKKGKGKKQKQQEPVKVELEEEDDDEDFDFGAIVHSKKQVKPQLKMEKKKVQKFSDEEDDPKAKKQAKKGGKKKVELQQEQKPAKEVKFQEEQEEEDVKKGKKKGKGKKGREQQEQKKQVPKKKEGKKKRQEEENEDEKEEQQQSNQEEAKKEEEEEEKPQKSVINSQIMDQLFKEAFLNVLKLSKVEAELPIDSGQFFSDYMILARSDATKLQIKDSSFKKLGKFYEQMAKQKFIEFKPAKEKKGQQGSTITRIIWENQELKNYVPSIKKMGEKEAEEKEEVFSKEKLKLSKTLTVDFVYKMTEEMKKVLLKKVVNYMPDNSDEEAEDVKKEEYLTEKELREKIEKYINEVAIKESKEDKKKEEKEEKEEQEEKEWKEGKDKGKQRKLQKMITLSYKDNEFIFNLLKKEIEVFEENLQHQEMMAHNQSDEEGGKKKNKKDKHKKNLFKIERNYLVDKIVKLARPCYSIADPITGLSKFKEGAFKGIQIVADKVMNKNVTKIMGIEIFIPANTKEDEIVKQIHGFAHELQLKFASNATVQNLPGKNAGREIVIQGNFADQLQALMIAEYGLKKEYISLQNKLGKKKKN